MAFCFRCAVAVPLGSTLTPETFLHFLTEEIKRDNIFQIDYARGNYLKYYKRDMEHNETVSKIEKQTAEIREQVADSYRVNGLCCVDFAEYHR